MLLPSDGVGIEERGHDDPSAGPTDLGVTAKAGARSGRGTGLASTSLVLGACDVVVDALPLRRLQLAQPGGVLDLEPAQAALPVGAGR